MMIRNGRLYFPLLLLVVALAAPLAAHAFPIAPPGTEGLEVVALGSDPVVATYQGNSAVYSNDLFLMLDGLGHPGDDGDLTNDLFIFNNHSTPVGTTLNLGTFSPGTELMFRLFVHDTGNNYYSGPASRNPDGDAHARVLNEWLPGTTLVSFEDLFGTPEGANGYNDLSFSFTNTTTVAASEPPTLALFGIGLGILVAGLRRRRA
jgi:hypothetical protein